MQISFLALSCGSVLASTCAVVAARSCGYIAAIKPEAVFMYTYICFDGGIKLIFKKHLFNSFLPIFIGKHIFRH